mgnify:CR=1 FL=1
MGQRAGTKLSEIVMGWQTIVKENNLDVSIIPFDQLMERIDAEYYRPRFLSGDRLIGNKQSTRLGDIADIKGGKRLPKGEVFSDNGIPYIRAEDVKNSFVEYENSPKISLELQRKLKSYQTKLDDVLITIVGNSIGDVGIVKFELEKCNLTENCAKLVNLKGINADYLFSFLLSKYGQNQIEREQVGTSQPKLALVRIRDFKLPVPNRDLQEKISEIIRRAQQLKESSKQQYVEAEKLLLKEINLEGYVPNEGNTSVRELTECLADNRFDAEYWEPRFDEMEERVSTIPQQELGNIISIQKGIDPGSEAYTESGKSFVRVSDISIYGIEDGDKKISDELYEELKDNYKPQKGEVLFTKDGTIGISFALHEDIDAIVSSAFLRLKPKIKINIDYLTLVLNSLYCKFQIERMSGGAIIAHLKPESVKKIKVPVLSDTKQEELAEKAVSSLRLRNEAKELLEKAKRAVEIFIEKDEQEALKYLASGKAI